MRVSGWQRGERGRGHGGWQGKGGGREGQMATEEWVTETKDREMLTKHKQKI